MLNPELRRNLWLELSPQRLLVMPLVLAALVYLAYEAGGASEVADIAWWSFVLLAVLWGTRLAAESVADEVQARTWDWQRLSSLRAWSLTWGKLVGAPVYAWYGALPALAVFAAASLHAGAGADTVGLRVALLLLAAACAHAVALMVSLHGVRRRDSLGAGRGVWPLLAGWLSAWPWLSLEQALEVGRVVPVRWFDRTWLGVEFGVASALVFTTLAWLACWRLMRAELQTRNAPWAWMAASVFLMGYAAGFVDGVALRWTPGTAPPAWWSAVVDLSPASLRALVAMNVALLLTYLMALWEPKSGVLVVRLQQAIEQHDMELLLALTPRWCYSLLLAFVAGLLVVVMAPELPAGTRGLLDSGVLVSAQLGFALRDLGLLMLLHFSARSRRADLAWLVYLCVLYVLAPALLFTAGLGGLSGWLLPRPDLDFGNAVLPVLVEAAAVGAAILWRWRNRPR